MFWLGMISAGLELMGHLRLAELLAISVALALAACGGNADGGSGGAGAAGGADGGSAASGGGGAGGSGGGISCAAQDARSDGTECAVLLGYAWNGSVCETVDCGCTGSDCDQLYVDEFRCLNAHAGCSGVVVPCGDNTCPAGEQCCNASCGICAAPGAGCPAIGCEPDGGGVGGGSGVELCGHRLCTGSEYCCNDSCGTCAAPDEGCTTQACAPNCEAMDAVAAGPCAAEIGYVWDGTQCNSISGCDCSGQDCGWVYPTAEICQQARRACPVDF